MTDPTIDSQIVTLKASGADAVHDLRHAEVRRADHPQDRGDRLEADAHPHQRIGFGRGGADAGRARQVGGTSSRPPTSSIRPIRSGRKEPGYQDWLDWMKKYYPGADLNDGLNRVRLRRRRRWCTC